MRVLILSCNTGEGHNSAGYAVWESMTKMGIQCEMKDFMSYMPTMLAKGLQQGHEWLYCHWPSMFGWGYRRARRHMPSALIKICRHATEQLWKEIRANQYCAVVCVHVFPALAMTRIRQIYRPPIDLYYISTDYTCHPGVGATDMDGYFIPHSSLSDAFIAAGVPEKKLFPMGIPTRAAFHSVPSSKVAREKLGLPPGKHIILIAGGSLGCGPLRKKIAVLMESLSSDCMLIVLCGRNQRLYRQLLPMQCQDKLKVIAFTPHMRDYMAASDLFLTKIGGLSMTEAIHMRLPLACIHAVPGCETENLKFGLRHEIVFVADSKEILNQIACCDTRLIIACEGIKQRMLELFPNTATDCISQYIIRIAMSKNDK